MRIEHIALWTDDLERTAAFYARYFGAAVGPKYTNPAKGFTSRFLSFAHGARLEAMSTTTQALERPPPGAQRQGWTHIAISLGSASEVDRLTKELEDAGVTVLDGPRQTGDGYYESVVLDPDGNRIELTI
jgi:lactoylglutathione lyase